MRFYHSGDLDRVLDAAEAAAREIIVKNLNAIDALARAFFSAPSGELVEHEIENVLDPYRPLAPPAEAPDPRHGIERLRARLAPREYFIRGRWGDVVGRVEQDGRCWRAFDARGVCRGTFNNSDEASRAL